jgi:hypothetical protein
MSIGRLPMLSPNLDTTGFVDQVMKDSVVGRGDCAAKVGLLWLLGIEFGQLLGLGE